MLLLIDNYDSFTYNLVQRIGELVVAGTTSREEADAAIAALDMRVIRNDKITVDEAVAMKPDRILISPGPCTPREAGISNDMVKAFAGKVPLMGVCLGHQCMGQVFGMTVDRNDRLMHGKTSPIHHDGKGLFEGLSNPMIATRYHSLVILRDTFDDERFEISAWTDEGEIMGLRAKPGIFGPNHPGEPSLDAPFEGVQFHPESFLTDEGPLLLANFLGLPRPAIQAAQPTA